MPLPPSHPHPQNLNHIPPPSFTTEPPLTTLSIQEYADVPPSLPDWLIPESKAHLVQATLALSQPQQTFTPLSPTSDDSDTPGLKDGIDWYIPPSDKQKYDAIYTTHKTPHGALTFSSLQPLYDSLDVPDTDLRSAWNLVNPASEPAIGKNAALAFLHILNQRHEGYRIPRSVPASLRSTFEAGQIDYNVESSSGGRGGVKSRAPPQQARYEDDTATGRKAKFGDTYLSRLGIGGGSGGYREGKGTDFSGVKREGEWEEVRLKRQLQELEGKIERVERAAAEKRGGKRDSRPALVKRELELLLDYKRKEIRELEQGEGRVKVGEGLKGVEGEIEGVREMVEGLERHLKGREEVLEGLRREIEAERRR